MRRSTLWRTCGTCPLCATTQADQLPHLYRSRPDASFAPSPMLEMRRRRVCTWPTATSSGSSTDPKMPAGRSSRAPRWPRCFALRQYVNCLLKLSSGLMMEICHQHDRRRLHACAAALSHNSPGLHVDKVFVRMHTSVSRWSTVIGWRTHAPSCLQLSIRISAAVLASAGGSTA